MISRRHRWVVMVGAVLVVTGGAFCAAPASAHDELGSSTPAAGSDVDRMPETVDLVFGGRPMDIGATVIVADADGEDWAEGPPEVVDGVVSAPVRDGAPDGFYQVRWRIVSEDGAVVSGHFGFGVGDTTGATPIPEPRSNDAAAQRPPGADAAGDFDLDTASPAGSSAGTSGPGVLRLIGVGLLGALAALGVAAVLTTIVGRRPRRPPTGTTPDPLEGS